MTNLFVPKVRRRARRGVGLKVPNKTNNTRAWAALGNHSQSTSLHEVANPFPDFSGKFIHAKKLRVVENRIEQCCAAHIVNCCQQY